MLHQERVQVLSLEALMLMACSFGNTEEKDNLKPVKEDSSDK